MEQIIKAFTGLFVMLVMSFTAIGIIMSSMAARKADSCLDTVALQWEASNFTLSEEDFYRSLDLNREEYALSLTKIPRKGSLKSGYASATLTYRYRIPVIGLETERKITKSMR